MNAAAILFDGMIFADYFQVYLHDEAHPDLPDEYSEEILARRLMAGPHAVIFHAVRNMAVPVRVEWHPGRPDPDLDSHQHVAETSLASPTGRLVLAGMTDETATAPRLVVTPGSLGMRICMSGLDTLSEDELDGEDRYLVQLWSGEEPAGIRVLKAWTP